MFEPKKILVPTDFSEFSDKALSAAVDIAKQHGSTIYLFHAIEMIQQCVDLYCISSAMVDTIQKEGMKSALEMMQAQIEKATVKGVEVIQAVVEGNAYREILREQEAKAIDLIVIASHGKTGIFSHLGSVTDSVARGARCPVLIVKSN